MCACVCACVYVYVCVCACVRVYLYVANDRPCCGDRSCDRYFINLDHRPYSHPMINLATHGTMRFEIDHYIYSHDIGLTDCALDQETRRDGFFLLMYVPITRSYSLCC